jgi:hypothetical protein
MSVELVDKRTKVTRETDCALRAEEIASGREQAEIIREVMHAWAVNRIHGATVLADLLAREGLPGHAGD